LKLKKEEDKIDEPTRYYTINQNLSRDANISFASEVTKTTLYQ